MHVSRVLSRLGSTPARLGWHVAGHVCIARCGAAGVLRALLHAYACQAPSDQPTRLRMFLGLLCLQGGTLIRAPPAPEGSQLHRNGDCRAAEPVATRQKYLKSSHDCVVLRPPLDTEALGACGKFVVSPGLAFAARRHVGQLCCIYSIYAVPPGPDLLPLSGPGSFPCDALAAA